MALKIPIKLSLKNPTHAVCVVGVDTLIDVYSDVPTGAKTFRVSGSSEVQMSMVYDTSRVTEPDGRTYWPLDAHVDVSVSVDRVSKDVDDLQVKVSYFGPRETGVLGQSVLYLTAVDVSLDVDLGRTGKVKKSRADKKTWYWGREGSGAILLVNCDSDSRGSREDLHRSQLTSMEDLQDMSPLLLSCDGPDEIFSRHKLILEISSSTSKRLRVFCARGGTSLSHYKQVLGPHHSSYEVQRQAGEKSILFHVAGLAFPSADFRGVVSLGVCLMEPGPLSEVPLFTEDVSFRVAPWIMTPNTQPPLELYVCRVMDFLDYNDRFLQDMGRLAQKANCKLVIVPQVDNRNDRWIQDEIEFGYIDAPHKSFPVVFDSPRNRGLKDFPYKKILGPDFGFVTRDLRNKSPSTLDSFGNLDVSPPVTVGDTEYPLGRILIGGCLPNRRGRRMDRVLRDFLWAQRVQAPVELYSDWLSVGHVDEFLSFVPTSDQKGFRLLLASPKACLQLFQEKQDKGYGTAALYDGVSYEARKTINEMLADRVLQKDSEHAQSCIDRNREMLKRELGLDESDIVDIPQLFVRSGNRADALFPNMVNMLVLGKHLGIPKPFGPLINGRCCLEEAVRSLLEPLGLHCTFIDDFLTYHQMLGEIHCGTNVRRKPLAFKWWNMVP